MVCFPLYLLLEKTFMILQIYKKLIRRQFFLIFIILVFFFYFCV